MSHFDLFDGADVADLSREHTPAEDTTSHNKRIYYTVDFYEEMHDKEAGRSAGRYIAVVRDSQVNSNGIPMRVGVGYTESRKNYAVRLMSVEYIRDFCIPCTQTYIQDTCPRLLDELRNRCFRWVLKPKGGKGKGRRSDS